MTSGGNKSAASPWWRRANTESGTERTLVGAANALATREFVQMGFFSAAKKNLLVIGFIMN